MPDESKILANLTPEQYQAVTHRDGPMLVIAGAGSGKTRVVTRRIAWLISRGIWPSQILAMTFTNKAAREMVERVTQLTGTESRCIGTFHSICARFLRYDIDKMNCGRNANFTILDSGEQLSIIKKAFKDFCIEKSSYLKPKLIHSIIGTAKNTSEPIEDIVFKKMDSAEFADIIEKIADYYETEMQKLNAMDFDDLLRLVVKMLKEHPEIKEMYNNRYRYILIDEYQDTNHIQYELMQLLLNERQNIHVTGDPDQCIYSWRNADYHNIMDFEKDFPKAKVIRLEQNYRSTKMILQTANKIIINNAVRYDKTLFTDNDVGCPVYVVATDNDKAEAEFVCQKVQEWQDAGKALNEIAVFYRTNAQSRVLEDAMILHSIPYRLFGGLRFYDRKEIKDLLAFLCIKMNPADEFSLTRIIKFSDHKIGNRTFLKFKAAADQHQMPIFSYLCSDEFTQDFCTKKTTTARKYKDFANWCRKLHDIPNTPLTNAFDSVWKFSNIEEALQQDDTIINMEERLENLQTLAGKAQEFEEAYPDADLTEFLQEVALVANIDNHNPNEESISIMTLHSAKGLEFPLVFITGVEKNLLPHLNSENDDDGIEEERRLFFVGITRARENLFISYAKKRYLYGHAEASLPSEFIYELPQDLIQYINYKGSYFPKTSRKKYY
ncbi:MAG: UvrD-helicase domain-containing protein [Lentisphaeria bacterium]